MSKKQLFLILLLISASVAYYFMTSTENLSPIEEKIASPQKTTFKQVINPILKIKIAQTDNTQCQEIWNLYTSKTWAEISEDIKREPPILSSACSDYLTKTFANSMIAPHLKDCLVTKNKKTCLSFLGMLRAYWVGRNVPHPYDVKDLEDSELMQLLAWNFMKDSHPSIETLNENILLADELMLRRPDLYNAAQAKLLQLFLKEVLHKDSSSRENFAQLIADLRKTENAEEAYKFWAIRELALNEAPELNLDVVRDYRKNFPKSDYPDYIEAGYYWRIKDRAQTISFLEKALAQNPQNLQAQESLERARTSSFDQHIFTFSASVNFTDF